MSPVAGGLRQQGNFAGPDRSGQGEIPPVLAPAGPHTDYRTDHQAGIHLGRTVGLRVGLSISAAVTLGIVFAAGLSDLRGRETRAVGAAEPWYGAMLEPAGHADRVVNASALLSTPAHAGGVTDGQADGLYLLIGWRPLPARTGRDACDGDSGLLRAGCIGTAWHEDRIPWLPAGDDAGIGIAGDHIQLETAGGPTATTE